MNIQVKNLQFSYGKRRVLSIDEAMFEKGNAYGIVGKNGVGKTTFFKTLVNINTNFKGEILINNLDMKKNLSLLGNVGIVLDDMSLYKNRTGMFNLKYFAGLRGGAPLESVYHLADELNIANILDLKVSTYSLGMMKKLQLLISMMNNAQVLIFDEPFRGLDAKTVDWFRDYLIKLKKEGRTILISSHIQEDIESISDYVYVLENGNFINKFDLNDKNSALQYQVEVSEPSLFEKLLEENNVDFKYIGDFIRFIATEEDFKIIFKAAVLEDIEFKQIKKEAQFSQFVK